MASDPRYDDLLCTSDGASCLWGRVDYANSYEACLMLIPSGTKADAADGGLNDVYMESANGHGHSYDENRMESRTDLH